MKLHDLVRAQKNNVLALTMIKIIGMIIVIEYIQSFLFFLLETSNNSVSG